MRRKHDRLQPKASRLPSNERLLLCPPHYQSVFDSTIFALWHLLFVLSMQRNLHCKSITGGRYHTCFSFKACS